MKADGGGNGGAGTHEAGAIARYRRVLTLLPRAYREERGEEMLGVMLDSAEDLGRDRPTFGELLSVLGLSLRLRTGATAASARFHSVGETMRLITLLGLLLQAVAFAQNVASGFTAKADFGPLGDVGGLTPGPAGVAVLGFLCPFLAMLALVRRRYRRGVLLAANPVVLVTEVPELFGTTSDLAIALGHVFAVLTLCLIPAVAGGFGFLRATPPIPRPYPWLATMVLLSVVFGDLDYANNIALGTAWALTSNLLAAGCACLAVLVVLTRKRHGGVWPTALMVVGAPLLCMLPLTTANLSYNPPSSMLFSPGSMYTFIGLYALSAEVLLAVVLATTLLRRLRTGTTSSTAD